MRDKPRRERGEDRFETYKNGRMGWRRVLLRPSLERETDHRRADCSSQDSEKKTRRERESRSLPSDGAHDWNEGNREKRGGGDLHKTERADGKASSVASEHYEVNGEHESARKSEQVTAIQVGETTRGNREQVQPG